MERSLILNMVLKNVINNKKDVYMGGFQWNPWCGGNMLERSRPDLDYLIKGLATNEAEKSKLAWNSWSWAFWRQHSRLNLDWAFSSNCNLAWFLLGLKKRTDILAWFLLGKKYVLTILLDSCLKIFWKLNYLLNTSW